METVGSTKLKNSLNSYLRNVKTGARYIITEHGRPVAKLVPVETGEGESLEEIHAELIAKGVLTLEQADAPSVCPEPVVRLKENRASKMLIEDRS